MNRKIFRFVVRLLVFTSLNAAAAYGISNLTPKITLPDIFPGLLLFFFVFTLIVHVAMVFSAQDKTELSISYFMATITAKLILSLIVVATLAYLYPEQMFGIVIWFFILYALFTAFEIISLLPILQANNDTK